MLLASEAENARLRATIIQLKSMIFGSRSEKRVTIIGEQLPLDLDAQVVTGELAILANDDQAGSPTETYKKPKRNIGAFRAFTPSRLLPKHLPRVDLLIEPETTIRPCCAGQLHRIGDDVSETLDRTIAGTA